MNGPGRRFDPLELTDEAGGPLPETDRRAAAGTAREIEDVAARGAGPTSDFTDRVMEAIATEPAPQPVIVFGSAVRAGRLRQAVRAVGDAWRVAFGPGRPLAVRGQAFALALIVLAGAVGLTGGAAIGAAQLLAPEPSPSPAPTELLPSPSPSVAPSPSPSPSASPESTEAPEPTETPEPSETPDDTDDHGGDRTPRPGDDSSGPGSGDDD